MPDMLLKVTLMNLSNTYESQNWVAATAFLLWLLLHESKVVLARATCNSFKVGHPDGIFTLHVSDVDWKLLVCYLNMA